MTANDIYRFAAAMVEANIKWHDQGPECTVTVLLQVLFYAAAQLCSVYAVCSRLRDAPNDQAVSDALAALCPEAGVLEKQFNQSFAKQLPKGLKKRPQRLAIDLTLIPNHGQPHRCSEEIYRSQAKSGTTHFHAYATCYVVHKGRRFTVAMMRVNQGTTMVEVLNRLLRQAIRAGIRLSLLRLDREFYSIDVVRYLQAARYAFMPVVIRGRRAGDPRGPSATRVFAVQKHSGWAKYTLTNSEKIKVTVRIGIHCRNWAGQRKRQGRQTLVYAFWGVRPKTTHWVYQVYRLRFGI
jgi:putative transposase